MKKMFSTLSLAVVAVGLALQLPVPAMAGTAEDVQAAMQLLKSESAALGAASVSGKDKVGDKTVPVLHFGKTAINNNFTIVDDVQQKTKATATFFVKEGNEFVRVATNVKKDDGSRAIGTVLDPKGKAIAAIAKDQSYYGEAAILGKPYITGYEPIHDAKNKVIGVYYVGYPKS
ncbi:MAG: Cache 3/Cache 2 fusion domain-containing protein [Geminicoccaceae bacterium]